MAALERPRRLVIMVKAGEPTDAVIQEFAPLLEPGDMIIDGGNAHFADTRRREHGAARAGHPLRRHGRLRRRGGRAATARASCRAAPAESYDSLGPMLEKISAKARTATPCVTHVGPDGAGHFVKMVHNGIEYADMQLIGEAYHLLRDVAGYSPAQIAEIFRTWNTGRLDSYLIEITAEVLAHVDAATGKPFVDVVADQAEQKGTGRWTVQIALDLGVPVSGIAEAVFARSLSGHAGLREAVPRPGRPDGDAARASRRRRPSPTGSSRRCTRRRSSPYTQGFHEIPAGGDEYGWDIDLGAVAAIWRGGCIIRAAFLDRIRAAYDAEPDLPSLLSDETFAQEIAAAQDDWREVLAAAARQGVPTPASPRPSRTTTPCAPSACPPRSPRASATSSAPTPTGARTARALPHAVGRATAVRPS